MPPRNPLRPAESRSGCPSNRLGNRGSRRSRGSLGAGPEDFRPPIHYPGLSAQRRQVRLDPALSRGLQGLLPDLTDILREITRIGRGSFQHLEQVYTQIAPGDRACDPVLAHAESGSNQRGLAERSSEPGERSHLPVAQPRLLGELAEGNACASRGGRLGLGGKPLSQATGRSLLFLEPDFGVNLGPNGPERGDAASLNAIEPEHHEGAFGLDNRTVFLG